MTVVVTAAKTCETKGDYFYSTREAATVIILNKIASIAVSLFLLYLPSHQRSWSLLRLIVSISVYKVSNLNVLTKQPKFSCLTTQNLRDFLCQTNNEEGNLVVSLSSPETVLRFLVSSLFAVTSRFMTTFQESGLSIQRRSKDFFGCRDEEK